jgi:RNA polymerase sigma-70 factor (ECF subfamily)
MCKNEYRKAEVRVSAAPEIFASAITKSSNTGDKKIDKDAFIGELDEALKEMDQVKRSTFIMRFKQGLSIKEISEVLECSQGTVKSRIFYTIKHLNKKLGHFKNIACLTLLLNTLI